jgi:membrane protein insertase Oxa1/YidC/SpoIIIJ
MFASLLGAALAAVYAVVPSALLAIVVVTAALHLAAIPWSRTTKFVPLLVQLPFVLGLFSLLRAMAAGSAAGLPSGSRLAVAVRAGHGLHSFGVDLGQTALAALFASPWSAVVVLALLGATLVAGRIQRGRAPMEGRSRMFDVLSVMGTLMGLALPLAIVVSFTTANVVRLAAGRLG